MAAVFDLDVLRSFVAAVESGSLVEAASRLGRSTSAMSAQMKRLEDSVGLAVFRKQGRGLELTETGTAMLSYARRLLDLNDEAAIAMRQIRSGGSCRLAIQQDFGDVMLPQVLRCFTRAHPSVQLDVIVAGNADLQKLVTNQTVDLAIAWDIGGFARKPQWRYTMPVCWVARPDWRAPPAGEPQALVMLGDDCYFRIMAAQALDDAQRSWRLAMTSPSLASVWAGVEAGLGITARTSLGIPASLSRLPTSSGPHGLPPLRDIAVAAFLPNGRTRIAQTLASLFGEAIAAKLPA